MITDQLSLHGWSASGYWSTGLSSLANDIPWVLIPFVVGAIGLLLGRTWREAYLRGDALSVGAFTLTWIFLFFMPQNLQIAIEGPVYLGYIALIVAFVWRNWHAGARGLRSSRATARIQTMRKPGSLTAAKDSGR